ncbi:FAD:protein FMN transferase [Eudoraea chungangensis]|uniref:FAD:protein FMN transferase n=1 Tax=Eudoraea chungangensis TaxID=1481905 RepID=UPI0023EDC6CA|nr:FAD:protein FMN transferase [Eudoraea chungangensis]
MRIGLVLILSLFFGFSGTAQQKRFVTVKRALTLMGSSFEITVVASNEEIGYINIEEAIAEIRRLERLISSWDPMSQTSEINRSAGIKPVIVDYELYALIERAVQISELTSGMFDISVASMDKIWDFDGRMTSFPSPEKISDGVSRVGYKSIVLNKQNHSVYLKEKGMKIGFGGIGKGFAADKVKELLMSKQVPGGMINAGGDITTWGTKSTGEKWLIGVDNPDRDSRFFTWLPLVESSVSISGIYQKYITFRGKKYSHYLDPLSGYPSTGIKKVTVFSKSAELCDALATAVYVMGKERGLALINQLGGIEVIIVDNFNRIDTSSGLLLKTTK